MLRRHFFILSLMLSLQFSTLAFAEPAKNYYADELVKTAADLKLDQDHYWHILLHYHPRWLGGVKSEIGSKLFFNAPNGRTSPGAELAATIRHFFDPVPSNSNSQPPQCAFIDRYRWLKSILNFDSKLLPETPCKDFEEWHNALDPDSVTLVFSSYYMSNPSSTFGHTLLRLNHRNHTKSERLLDYGVNYAANPSTTNALLYGVLGMIGGFDGQFSNIPYYLKVQEYGDIESRDLWEYDLNLTPAEVERLMTHLWAIGHVPISYYFFDKNCSFMIMALLDAARPELDLSHEFNNWWVIPSDTIRGVNQKSGLVTAVNVRPSIAYRIQKQRSELDADQDRVFLNIIQSPEESAKYFAEMKTWPNSRSARVMDLTLDYLRFLKVKLKNKLTAEYSALQTELLGSRSDIPEKPIEIRVTDEEIANQRPDHGHPTSRFSIGGGYNQLDGPFTSFGIRAAFHDLNAQSMGYPRSAEIVLLSVDAHFNPQPSTVRFENIDLIDVVSVVPWDRVFRKISWAMRLGAAPVRDFNCGDCLEYQASAGAGIAFQLGRSSIAYLLGKAELGFGANYTPSYRLGPAGELGWLTDFSDSWSLRVSASYHFPVLGYTPPFYLASAETRVSTSRSTDMRLGYDLYPIESQGRLIFNVYF